MAPGSLDVVVTQAAGEFVGGALVVVASAAGVEVQRRELPVEPVVALVFESLPSGEIVVEAAVRAPTGVSAPPASTTAVALPPVAPEIVAYDYVFDGAIATAIEATCVATGRSVLELRAGLATTRVAYYGTGQPRTLVVPLNMAWTAAELVLTDDRGLADARVLAASPAVRIAAPAATLSVSTDASVGNGAHDAYAGVHLSVSTSVGVLDGNAYALDRFAARGALAYASATELALGIDPDALVVSLDAAAATTYFQLVAATA